MKILKALGIFSLASLCQSLIIKDVHITFPDTSARSIMVGPVDSETKKLTKPITLDILAQTVKVNFVSDTRLLQETLLLGLPDRGLEQPFQASLKEKQGLFLYTFALPINQISPHLLHLAIAEGQLLTGSLVLAEERGGLSLPLFDIKLDIDKGLFDYVRPERLEAKPEIHHVFNAAPKTVSWTFAHIFSIFIVLALFGLLVSWMSSGATTWIGLPRGLNFLYFLAFIGSATGFEFIFASYYSGTGIFDTLKYSFLLSIPSLWLGTHFLRNWGKELN